MEKTFTKIKSDGSKVMIAYEVERKDGGDADEYSMHSADKPRPEFDAALQALATDVVYICELIPSDVERLRVRGVTLTHSNGILGACITALKTLKSSNAPLVINTPHLPVEPYSDGDDNAPTMPSGMADRIAAVEAEAQRYLDNDRAQVSLFAGATKDELLTTAAIHEAAAKLGEMGECSISFADPSGKSGRVEFSAETAKRNRATAKKLREAARAH